MKKIFLTIFILFLFQGAFACSDEKECIGLALKNRNNFKTALYYLDRAVKFNEQSEQGYYYRALLKFENGKRRASIKDYDILIARYPDNWIYYFNRGYVCYSLGQVYLVDAASSFQNAYNLNPDVAIAKLNYSIAMSARDAYMEMVSTLGLVAGAINSKTRQPVGNLDIDLWGIFDDPEDNIKDAKYSAGQK